MHIIDFCIGESNGAESSEGSREDLFRQGYPPVVDIQKPFVDRVRHLRGKLLSHDRGAEIMMNILPFPQTKRLLLTDHLTDLFILSQLNKLFLYNIFNYKQN